MEAIAAGANGVHFDAVMVPRRSLSGRGCLLLPAVVASVLGAMGFGFWRLGAWPVAGFCGLEALLLAGAFAASHRSGRLVEWLRLDEETLSVSRIDTRGRTARWSFEPGWVRVAVENGPGGGRLVLSSHGRFLRLGAFLTDGERREVAAALAAALARWRDGGHR